MSKRQGTERRAKSQQLLVRLEPAEHSRLAELAAAGDMTLAEYARRRLLGGHIIAKGDAAIIRELRRTGGIAMLAIRTRGLAEAGRTALADIRRAISHLSER